MGDADSAIKDNWAGKAANMRCSTCIYFVDKEGKAQGIGRCRRHAPALGGWPVVYGEDWCGDHKIDENKLAKR